MQETVGLEIRKVNSFGRREAVGFNARAAHGSGVGAEIRGWRRPGVIEAGWKMSGILLFKQNTATFGTPEKSSSLRLKTLFREQNSLFTHRGLHEGEGCDTLTVSETNCLECGVLNNICSVALNKAVPSPARTNNRANHRQDEPGRIAGPSSTKSNQDE